MGFLGFGIFGAIFKDSFDWDFSYLLAVFVVLFLGASVGFGGKSEGWKACRNVPRFEGAAIGLRLLTRSNIMVTEDVLLCISATCWNETNRRSALIHQSQAESLEND